MRKFKCLLALFWLAALVPAAALAAPPEQTKLIVAGWTVSPEAVEAGADCTLTLTVRNTHSKKDAYNLTVSISPDRQALLSASQTVYREKLAAGEEFDAAFSLKTLAQAGRGAYPVEVTLDYEDSRGVPCTVTQTLTVAVIQPLRLRADTPSAAAVNPGEPVTVRTTIHNLGKDRIYNLSATVDGAQMTCVTPVYGGHLDSGESLEIAVTVRMDDAVAEALRQSDAWDTVTPGDPDPVENYPAELALTYEDADGQTYPLRLQLSVPILIPKPEEPVYSLSETDGGESPAPDLTGWVVAGLALAAAAAAVLAAVWTARKRSASR